jgi:hypothetical protein
MMRTRRSEYPKLFAEARVSPSKCSLKPSLNESLKKNL